MEKEDHTNISGDFGRLSLGPVSAPVVPPIQAFCDTIELQFYGGSWDKVKWARNTQREPITEQIKRVNYNWMNADFAGPIINATAVALGAWRNMSKHDAHYFLEFFIGMNWRMQCSMWYVGQIGHDWKLIIQEQLNELMHALNGNINFGRFMTVAVRMEVSDDAWDVFKSFAQDDIVFDEECLSRS